MSTKRIFLIRHGQAEHNLSKYTHQVAQAIPDPPLTQLGITQVTSISATPIGKYLNSSSNPSILLVSSPLRRTIQTTLLGLPDLKNHISALPHSNGIGLILLPQVHESGPNPCDTGSPIDVIKNGQGFEFGKVPGIDWSQVEQVEQEWRIKKGFWSSNHDDLKVRAAWVRRWLRAREESEIVVVCHNGMLDFISRGEHTEGRETWPNAEIRVFRFKDGDDATDQLASLERISDEELKQAGII